MSRQRKRRCARLSSRAGRKPARGKQLQQTFWGSAEVDFVGPTNLRSIVGALLEFDF